MVVPQVDGQSRVVASGARTPVHSLAMITVAQLREAIRRTPFRPFTVRTADGSEYPIPHPEFMAIHPRRSRDVFLFSSEGGYAIVDPFLMVSINYADEPPQAHGGSERGPD